MGDHAGPEGFQDSFLIAPGQILGDILYRRCAHPEL